MAEATRQTERDEALGTIRRQADALRRRGFDDASAVDAAADTLERLIREAYDGGFKVSGEGWNGEHPGEALPGDTDFAEWLGEVRRG
jgi:hypothetical protein